MSKAKLTKQQIAARKAVATRTARNDFRKKYGEKAYNACMSLIRWNRTALPVMSEAGYRSMLTRDGKFSSMAHACNFNNMRD